MGFKDLRIKLTHEKAYIYENCDDVPYSEENEIINVCDICLMKDKDLNKNCDVVATIGVSEKTMGDFVEKLNVCILSDYKYRQMFFQELDDNFCLDMDIYEGEKKIGNVSFNRIFVESAQDIGIWLDNEAPNSMKIGTYIYKNDFKIVEGRYVGIIDELILDKKYIKEGWADCAIYMIYSLILAWGFKIYYLYTQPKSSVREEYMEDVIATSNLKTYLSLGFEIVNNYKSILRKDMWHETKDRLEFDDGMEKIYLP